MRTLGIVALCVTLGGCATISYVMQEYHDVPVQEVRMSDDTYRIFDKPAASKLMVTSSLSSAAGQGFVKGLTFGAVPTDAPKPLFEAASLQFLSENGRPGCRIVDAYLLAQPQWEVKYDCSPPPASPATATKRRINAPS
jgi:hypothetical protein